VSTQSTPGSATPDPTANDGAAADGAAPGPEGMTRRQLARHAGWFGAAVVLSVSGGEVISHVAHDKDSAAAAAQDSTLYAPPAVPLRIRSRP